MVYHHLPCADRRIALLCAIAYEKDQFQRLEEHQHSSKHLCGLLLQEELFLELFVVTGQNTEQFSHDEQKNNDDLN